MMRFRLVPVLLILAAGLSASATGKPLPAMFDPERHMSIDEVKPGMKGYGLSVFRGTEIERFEVEVISVLQKLNPKHDVILIKFGGQNLEHTGGIQGMSGSPVYLVDEQGRTRLIGAFAYVWPLQKDPVGGVQPIEYMLALPEPPKDDDADHPPEAFNGAIQEKPAQAYWRLSDSVMLPGMTAPPHGFPLSAWNSLTPNPALSRAVDPMRRQPLATPMMTTGLSGTLLERLGPLFQSRGLVPLQAGGVPPQRDAQDLDTRIRPGATLAVPLLSGDIDMTAIGTCTEVIGQRIWGFGHSFNNEGTLELPFGAGRIHHIIANIMVSFKLGSLTELKGTLNTDQLVGIAGRLGEIPKMAPLELTVTYEDGSVSDTFHCRVIRHSRYTPIISASAMAAAVVGARDLPPFHTLDYDLKLEFSNGETLDVQNRSVNASIGELFYATAMPMMAAAGNPFENVLLDKLTGTVHVSGKAREATILAVNVPKLKHRPGETLKGFISYRPFRAVEANMPIELELPRDLPDGQYQLVISDHERFLSDEMSATPFRFTAGNAREVFAVLRDVASIRHNAVYVRLLRQPDGVAIGRTAMPHLPSSRREIFLGAGRSNTTPFVSSTVKTIPTDFVMRGSADFVIEIDRDVRVEQGRVQPRHDAPAAKPDAAPQKESGREPASDPPKEESPREPSPKVSEEMEPSPAE